MSASAPLLVVIELNIDYGVLFVTKSDQYSDIGNFLSFVEIPSINQNRCVLSRL